MPDERNIARFWAVLVLLATVAVLLRPAPADPRLPAAEAQPWMAESLPGIGPVTAAAMTTAIRAGDLAALPTSAQAAARSCFHWDDDPQLGSPGAAERMAP